MCINCRKHLKSLVLLLVLKMATVGLSFNPSIASITSFSLIFPITAAPISLTQLNSYIHYPAPLLYYLYPHTHPHTPGIQLLIKPLHSLQYLNIVLCYHPLPVIYFTDISPTLFRGGETKREFSVGGGISVQLLWD